MSAAQQLARRDNHTRVSPQTSTRLLTQLINNRCQVGLKQAGSTSLAVINCLPCFPMILSVAGRDRLQLCILGVDSGSASHRSRDLSLPSLAASPFNLSTLPSASSGRTGSGRVRRPRWWIMVRAGTWSTCQDFPCRPRGMAITISANNWRIMKMDGVSSKCSEVASHANSQHLFQSVES